MSLPLPPKVADLRGRTFGRLTVREFAGVRDGKAYWTCDCCCGAVKEVRGSKLTDGGIVSCGCQRADAIVRQAARLTMPEEARKLAASGHSVSPPKAPPRRPKAPRAKRILPFIGDRASVSARTVAITHMLHLGPTWTIKFDCGCSRRGLTGDDIRREQLFIGKAAQCDRHR
jgi:hypothetical protein